MHDKDEFELKMTRAEIEFLLRAYEESLLGQRDTPLELKLRAAIGPNDPPDPGVSER